MKRGRDGVYGPSPYGYNLPYKKPRTVAPMRQPTRAYRGSRVPLATRGYKLNASELKVADVDWTTQDINTTGDFQLLAAPIPGSDMTNRIGRKITIRSIYLRGVVTQQLAQTCAAGTSFPSLCRLIVFADMQPNGAAPGVTDLLKEAHSTSQLNLNNRDRFKIYCDEVWALGPWVSVTTATQAQMVSDGVTKPFKIYKKIKLPVIFNAGSAGTVADITSGALYYLWIGNNTSSVNDAVAQISSRCRYADF